MLRRRVKEALKRRAPGLVLLRDTLRDWSGSPSPAPADAPAAPVQVVVEPPPSTGLDRAAIQAVLDDMVRPALQSDGGDITLVRVEGNDVFVSLVGACHTCPSATMTLRMGVERLLKEEFPSMERLVEVGGALHL